MQYLTEAEILLIHFKLIKRFGGSQGLRDISRIKSVLSAPKLVAFGHEQYTTLHQKAAVYVRNIIADHPFVDGNKRTGMAAGLLFLQRNGYIAILEIGELEDFAVKVAKEHMEISQIADWLKLHSKKK